MQQRIFQTFNFFSPRNQNQNEIIFVRPTWVFAKQIVVDRIKYVLELIKKRILSFHLPIVILIVLSFRLLILTLNRLQWYVNAKLIYEKFYKYPLY